LLPQFAECSLLYSDLVFHPLDSVFQKAARNRIWIVSVDDLGRPGTDLSPEIRNFSLQRRFWRWHDRPGHYQVLITSRYGLRFAIGWSQSNPKEYERQGNNTPVPLPVLETLKVQIKNHHYLLNTNSSVKLLPSQAKCDD
jgi:hypothetical protein